MCAHFCDFQTVFLLIFLVSYPGCTFHVNLSLLTHIYIYLLSLLYSLLNSLVQILLEGIEGIVTEFCMFVCCSKHNLRILVDLRTLISLCVKLRQLFSITTTASSAGKGGATSQTTRTLIQTIGKHVYFNLSYFSIICEPLLSLCYCLPVHHCWAIALFRAHVYDNNYTMIFTSIM